MSSPSFSRPPISTPGHQNCPEEEGAGFGGLPPATLAPEAMGRRAATVPGTVMAAIAVTTVASMGPGEGLGGCALAGGLPSIESLLRERFCCTEVTIVSTCLVEGVGEKDCVVGEGSGTCGGGRRVINLPMADA